RAAGSWAGWAADVEAGQRSGFASGAGLHGFDLVEGLDGRPGAGGPRLSVTRNADDLLDRLNSFGKNGILGSPVNSGIEQGWSVSRSPAGRLENAHAKHFHSATICC